MKFLISKMCLIYSFFLNSKLGSNFSGFLFITVFELVVRKKTILNLGYNGRKVNCIAYTLWTLKPVL